MLTTTMTIVPLHAFGITGPLLHVSSLLFDTLRLSSLLDSRISSFQTTNMERRDILLRRSLETGRHWEEGDRLSSATQSSRALLFARKSGKEVEIVGNDGATEQKRATGQPSDHDD